MSDYQRVAEFNKSFDFPQHVNFSDAKCLKLRLDLIDEEIKELIEAYSNQDFVEEQDACADILYVAYGMAWTYKIDSDVEMKKYKTDPGLTLFQNIKCNYKLIIDKKAYVDMIKETFNKLTESCANYENREWVNILHTLIHLVYEFQVVSGYDSDKIFRIVHDSNMSKLCETEEIAKLTVEKYKKDFESGKSGYDSPYYYPLETGPYVVKNKSTGKALKSINYVAVNLT